MKVLTSVFVLVFVLVLPVWGDIYTWVDENGVKHFSTEPPPNEREVERRTEIRHGSGYYDQREAQRKSDQADIIDEGRSGEKTSDGENRGSKRIHNKAGKVVMFATPTCGYCARARAFFAKHGIAYTEYDITKDRQARRRYTELNGRGVPLIFVGDTRVPGFNEQLLRRLLGIK